MGPWPSRHFIAITGNATDEMMAENIEEQDTEVQNDGFRINE